MPFASEAQRRKFYATVSLRKHIPEFEAGTKGSLPERVGGTRSKQKRRMRKHRRTALGAMLAHTKSVHR